MEQVLDQRRLSLGRGPGVDLAFDDSSLAREHALLEFRDGSFHLEPLSASAETRVQGGSGSSACATALKSRDRFVLGAIQFSYIVEPRRSPLE